MAVQAFCTTCQRMVYIEEGETAVCPVCSSPLIEATESASDNGEQSADETAAENA